MTIRGVAPSPSEVHLSSGSGYAKCTLSGPESLQRVHEIAPEGKLDKWQTSIGPSSAVIKPLGERDLYTDSRQVGQRCFLGTDSQIKERLLEPKCLLTV